MGDPIKKVDLDDILRSKVEESQFSFSEEHWNKLNVELTKQREKKSAFKGIVLLLQNRWVQSGLVAAVAVFATYLFMTNFSSDAVKQTPSAQNSPKVQAPSSSNENTPLTSDNDVTNLNNNSVNNTSKGEIDNNKLTTPPVNNQAYNEDDNGFAGDKIYIVPVNKKDKEKEPVIPSPSLKQNTREPLLALKAIDKEGVQVIDKDKEVPSIVADNTELEQFHTSAAPDSTLNKQDGFKMFALEGIGIKAGMSIAPTYVGAQQRTARGTTFGFFSSFKLTPKLSLQAEALFTQVKGHQIGRTETRGETVYTDNGMSSYNYTETFVEISGLNYFRFPVLVKYKLSDKLSVGAGGYYSRLESPLGSETELVYDDVPSKTANAKYIDPYTVGNPVTTLSTSSVDNRSYSNGGITTQNSGLRNYDAGIVLDAQFKLKRWCLGARFNQGITDITPNDIYNVNKVHKTNTSTEITIGFLF